MEQIQGSFPSSAIPVLQWHANKKPFNESTTDLSLAPRVATGSSWRSVVKLPRMLETKLRINGLQKPLDQNPDRVYYKYIGK